MERAGHLGVFGVGLSGIGPGMPDLQRFSLAFHNMKATKLPLGVYICLWVFPSRFYHAGI